MQRACLCDHRPPGLPLAAGSFLARALRMNAPRFRRSAAALVLVSACFGCVYFSSSQRFPPPTLRAADLNTERPLPPVLLVRVAQRELTSLDGAQIEALEMISARADRVSRPIDAARVVYLEILARVLDGSERPAAIEPARARLVAAIAAAAGDLEGVVRELHGALAREERSELARDFAVWVARHEPAWSGTPKIDWVDGFAADELTRVVLDGMRASVEDDAARWSAAVERRVGEALAGTADRPSDAARRELARRLRADDPRP